MPNNKNDKPKKRIRRLTISLGIFGGLMPTFVSGINGYKARGITGGIAVPTKRLIGYNIESARFEPSELKAGLLPLMIGIGAHKLASRLGVNKMLAQAGIPIFRI